MSSGTGRHLTSSSPTSDLGTHTHTHAYLHTHSHMHVYPHNANTQVRAQHTCAYKKRGRGREIEDKENILKPGVACACHRFGEPEAGGLGVLSQAEHHGETLSKRWRKGYEVRRGLGRHLLNSEFSCKARLLMSPRSSAHSNCRPRQGSRGVVWPEETSQVTEV